MRLFLCDFHLLCVLVPKLHDFVLWVGGLRSNVHVWIKSNLEKNGNVGIRSTIFCYGSLKSNCHFLPFWQCCKKVYPFNCHVGNMSTQSDAVVTKSNKKWKGSLLIPLFWPFWQCCKKVYPFNCHVGCMSTQSVTLIKSIRPLYHIDKNGRPFSILTGKLGRPNSNIAKKCVFWGRHKDTFIKSIRPLYHIYKKGRPYSISKGRRNYNINR